MHKDDKNRIQGYENVLASLKEIEIPGDIVETTEGFIRKRVVARRFVFNSVEEAQQAKRQVAELKREVNTYKKQIKEDIKTIRTMYKEMVGKVGSGSGFAGALFGNKQNIIQAKAQRKRQYESERDARIADYERTLKGFDNLVYVFDAVRSDADDFIANHKNG